MCQVIVNQLHKLTIQYTITTYTLHYDIMNQLMSQGGVYVA